MLSAKFFAIAGAILAAAVNASPVEVAKRDGPPSSSDESSTTPVRSLVLHHLVSCGRVANEVQTLTALLTRSATSTYALAVGGLRPAMSSQSTTKAATSVHIVAASILLVLTLESPAKFMGELASQA